MLTILYPTLFRSYDFIMCDMTEVRRDWKIKIRRNTLFHLSVRVCGFEFTSVVLHSASSSGRERRELRSCAMNESVFITPSHCPYGFLCLLYPARLGGASPIHCPMLPASLLGMSRVTSAHQILLQCSSTSSL